MPYYGQGDWYRGDYYGMRGDPGFLSSLGGLMSSFGGSIPVVGGLVSGVGGMLSRKGVKSVAAPAAAGLAGAANRTIMGASSIVKAHPVLTAVGAAGLVGAAAGAGAERMLGAGGACPKGWHISHSKHAKHFGQCVRNRRMRVTNPKALRRAIRRTSGFAKLAMRTIHLVHPKKHARFGGFRRKKKR